MEVFDSQGNLRVDDGSLASPAVLPTGNIMAVAPPSVPGAASMVVSPGGSAAGVWPAANRAIYIPFLVESDTTIPSMVVLNDATVAGTVDVGIFNASYQRVTQITGGAGATMTGASAPQSHDTPDVTLTAGSLYYMAMVSSSATATFMRSTPGTLVLQSNGVQQEALGSAVLPATMTPANPASNYLPNVAAVVSAIGGTFVRVVPTHVSSFGRWSSLFNARGQIGIGAPASGAWPAANQAVFLPFFLPWSYDIRRMFWANGSDVTGHYDIGVFLPGGNAIVRAGTTVQSGASAIQYVTVSPTVTLPPGMYLLGLWNDGTTNRAFASTQVTANLGVMMGMFQQTGLASALPSSATLATWASAVYPLCGFTNTSSGF